MKHILLPVDFSSDSWNSVKYALYLFENEETTFYILNSYQASPSELSSRINRARSTRLHDAVRRSAEHEMEDFMKRIRESHNNAKHTIKSVLVPDSLMNAVGRTAISNKISYIFMGTKGSTAAKEIFMGSSTVSIIKNIDFCPVIAVPGDYSYDIPEQILFPTDYKRTFEEQEIKPLKELALLWNSTIRVLHIQEDPNLTDVQHKNKEELKKLLSGISIAEEEINQHKSSIAEIINEYSQNASIGMLAMVNNQHSFVEKLLNERVIKRVAFKTGKPFLVMPEVH